MIDISNDLCGTIKVDGKTLKVVKVGVRHVLTTQDNPVNIKQCSCGGFYLDEDCFHEVDHVITKSINSTVNNKFTTCGGVSWDAEVFKIDGVVVSKMGQQGVTEQEIDGVLTAVYDTTTLTGEYQKGMVVAEFIFDHGVPPYQSAQYWVWNNEYTGQSDSDGYFYVGTILNSEKVVIGAKITTGKTTAIPNQTYKLGVKVKDKNGLVKAYQKTIVANFDIPPESEDN